MAESQIITSQYVQIEQTPAGVGERIFARILDYLIIFLYMLGMIYLLEESSLGYFFDEKYIIVYLAFFLPVVFYSFLWEVFNNGRSPGKMAFGMRVVMKDGTTPTIGAYFIRWMLLLIDTWLWIGVLVILVNNHNQRLGDLAAGTYVIKERNYRKINVSLDEFNHLSRGYKPYFPQAENLSLEQVNTISETLSRYDSNRLQRISVLSGKVKEYLKVQPVVSDEQFLSILIRDYQYYAFEEV
jgi:uncharacterized RDD family membrane protein YckC